MAAANPTAALSVLPRLSVRALAELLVLPAYEQVRIIHEQKYPKKAPGVFKTPFYAPALKTIRDYYRSGNKSSKLQTGKVEIAQLNHRSRRDSNTRIVDAFAGSAHANRKLVLQPVPRLQTAVSQTELRVAWDLIASEEPRAPHIFFNFRVAALDADVARISLELAVWASGETGEAVAAKDAQYIDLACGGATHEIKSVRNTTLKHAAATVKVVEALWNTI